MHASLKNMLLAGVVLLCGTAMSARADIVVTFDNSGPGALAPGSTNAQIAQYMDGLLGCVNCVTVSGASVDTTYSGDSHVVGNNGKSLTLGTSNGATNNSTLTPSSTYDNFLSNVTNSASTVSNGITMTFSQPVNLKSFDFEIFPDASCPNKYSCPSLPDFELYINGSGTATFTQLGAFPGSTSNSSTHTGTDGSSTKSPYSGSGTEQAAQWIGTWSGNLTNVTEIQFMDWPAAIGVDNIDFGTVPEPRGGALLLGGLLLAGLAGKKLFATAKA